MGASSEPGEKDYAIDDVTEAVGIEVSLGTKPTWLCRGRLGANVRNNGNCLPFVVPNLLEYGGMDETRTRDLLRDRQTL